MMAALKDGVRALQQSARSLRGKLSRAQQYRSLVGGFVLVKESARAHEERRHATIHEKLAGASTAGDAFRQVGSKHRLTY